MHLTNRSSQLRKLSRAGWPPCEATSVCLPRHPAVAYLFLVRSMRLIVLLAITATAAHALVADTVPVVVYESKDPHGERVQYRSDTNTLWKTPQWTPGNKGPPLSIEAATKIATDAGLRQVPKANGISFGEIKLLKNVFDYSGGRVVTWFWVFSVSPVIDEHPDQATEPIIEPARDIVILLDGKVLDATPVK